MARRFAFRAWLLAGRLPWLAFLIFRVGFAMRWSPPFGLIAFRKT